MSKNSYPHGNDKSLLKAIVNYLDELSKLKDKINDDEMEQIGVARDTLESLCDNNKINFKLQDLYEEYLSKNANNNGNNNDNNNDINRIDPEKQKKFFDFVVILTKHKFFDNIEVGSNEYLNRLEKARVSYNKKYPNVAIDSLNELDLEKLYKICKGNVGNKNNNVDDNKSSAGEVKKASDLKAEGNKLLQKRKFKEAIAKYEEAIALDPDNAVYYSNMAAAYSYVKDYKNAAKHAYVF